MAAKRYLSQLNGNLTEVPATITSAGSGDDGKIPGLDATGRLDVSLMPVGIGPDTQVITSSEALAAGDWVNVHNASGAKVRKADASVPGKEAQGFVLSAFASGVPVTVYFEGTNTQVTGQVPGVVYLSTTPGQGTSTAPTGAGQIAQRIGVATSATTVNFQQQPPITLA